MQENQNKVLSIRNLNIEFTSRDTKIKAVNSVNLELYKNEILGIVRESESGKSTIGRFLMGLLNPNNSNVSADEALIEHGNLTDFKNSEFRKIRGNFMSLVFQNASTALNPVYNIENQIIEVLREHQNISQKEARERALEYLEQVELPNPKQIAKQYPHELSGGMQQRVMIAIAIACGPKILIADEPTTALDVTTQAEILQLIKQLRDEIDMSIIFISHDLGVISELCDRTIVMLNGSIVEAGVTQQVLRKPEHEYTKGLIGAIPSVKVDQERLGVY